MDAARSAGGCPPADHERLWQQSPLAHADSDHDAAADAPGRGRPALPAVRQRAALRRAARAAAARSSTSSIPRSPTSCSRSAAPTGASTCSSARSAGSAGARRARAPEPASPQRFPPMEELVTQIEAVASREVERELSDAAVVVRPAAHGAARAAAQGAERAGGARRSAGAPPARASPMRAGCSRARRTPRCARTSRPSWRASEEALPAVEEELRLALVERDPNDERNVIIELRPGAGGDEAALFTGDIYRMLTAYAERLGFKTEHARARPPSDQGGFREVTFEVRGDGAYSVFKWESGVHRVQRVPETESQGRIHTSTMTVAVLPEAEEVEVQIDRQGHQDRRHALDRARAASRSTRPTPPCASRTCRPASSCRARTSARRSRTASARSRSCARACYEQALEERNARRGGRAALADRHGRALREDPHLQLPRAARHRPPHQAHRRTTSTPSSPATSRRSRRRSRTRTEARRLEAASTADHGPASSLGPSARVPGGQGRALAAAGRRVPARRTCSAMHAARAVPRPRPPARARRGRPPARARAPPRPARAARLRARQLGLLRASSCAATRARSCRGPRPRCSSSAASRCSAGARRAEHRSTSARARERSRSRSRSALPEARRDGHRRLARRARLARRERRAQRPRRTGSSCSRATCSRRSPAGASTSSARTRPTSPRGDEVDPEVAGYEPALAVYAERRRPRRPRAPRRPTRRRPAPGRPPRGRGRRGPGAVARRAPRRPRRTRRCRHARPARGRARRRGAGPVLTGACADQATRRTTRRQSCTWRMPHPLWATAHARGILAGAAAPRPRRAARRPRAACRRARRRGVCRHPDRHRLRPRLRCRAGGCVRCG